MTEDLRPLPPLGPDPATIPGAVAAPAPVPGPPAWKPPFASVASWVLYDLANTIYSMNIASLYFSLWVVNVMGGLDRDFAWATSISQALIFVLAPFIGALTDQAPRRVPFLVVTTLVCFVFTGLLGH